MARRSLEVLLVEDNLVDQMALRRMLEQMPEEIKVVCATDYRTTERLVAQEDFDCVLISWSLPDGRGLDLIESAPAGLPIIILTALHESDAARAVLEAGAQDFLVKGRFNHHDLRRVIQFAIERRRALDLEVRVHVAERLSATGQMAAGVADEVNNPLTCIVANQVEVKEKLVALEDFLGALHNELVGRENGLERLLAQWRPFEALADCLQLVEDNTIGTTRIASVVGRLKGFAVPPLSEQSELDLSEVVAEAARLVDSDTRHRATVQLDLGPLPTITADRSALVHVMVNLLVNAFQALDVQRSGPQNKIRCQTWSGGGSVFASVEDSGLGVSESIKNHVFDPFVTTKSTSGGSGLGLSVCREVVEAHGGSIELQSSSLGGARFVVRLPTETGLQPPRDNKNRKAIAPASHQLRLLVVDDEPRMLKAMRRALSDHDVVTASGGRQGLRVLADGGHFDGILCDLMMPLMDGMTFFEQVCDLHPGLKHKVVFFTGGAVTPKLQRFLGQFGQHRLLDKPFSAHDLDEVLERWSDFELRN